MLSQENEKKCGPLATMWVLFIALWFYFEYIDLTNSVVTQAQIDCNPEEWNTCHKNKMY